MSRRSQLSVHAVLAQLPFGLWGISFIFDLASRWRGPALVQAAFFNLVAGLIFAVAAAISGLWDYHRRLPPGSPEQRCARLHACANALTSALFIASLWLRWHHPVATVTPRLPFVLSAFGVALLGVAAYLGGMVAHRRSAPQR